MSNIERQVRGAAAVHGIGVRYQHNRVWLFSVHSDYANLYDTSATPECLCFSWEHALATIIEPGAIDHLKS